MVEIPIARIPTTTKTAPDGKADHTPSCPVLSDNTMSPTEVTTIAANCTRATEATASALGTLLRTRRPKFTAAGPTPAGAVRATYDDATCARNTLHHGSEMGEKASIAIVAPTHVKTVHAPAAATQRTDACLRASTTSSRRNDVNISHAATIPKVRDTMVRQLRRAIRAGPVGASGCRRTTSSRNSLNKEPVLAISLRVAAGNTMLWNNGPRLETRSSVSAREAALIARRAPMWPAVRAINWTSSMLRDN